MTRRRHLYQTVGTTRALRANGREKIAAALDTTSVVKENKRQPPMSTKARDVNVLYLHTLTNCRVQCDRDSARQFSYSYSNLYSN